MPSAGLKAKIEERLTILVGMPMWRTVNAGSMQMFSFGAQETVIDHKGKERTRGEYALHASAAWRLVGPDGILMGAQDYFHPAGDISEDYDPDSFDPENEENRLAAAAKAFRLSPGFPHKVLSIEADHAGGLRLKLSKGYMIDVMPTSSMPWEYWRFFSPSSDDSHFVVTGRGVEE